MYLLHHSALYCFSIKNHYPQYWALTSVQGMVVQNPRHLESPAWFKGVFNSTCCKTTACFTAPYQSLKFWWIRSHAIQILQHKKTRWKELTVKRLVWTEVNHPCTLLYCVAIMLLLLAMVSGSEGRAGSSIWHCRDSLPSYVATGSVVEFIRKNWNTYSLAKPPKIP